MESLYLEVKDFSKKLKVWKNLFFIKYELYIDGWAIYLREKIIDPRVIIIFKSYDTGVYSIRSFETKNKLNAKEQFVELYNEDNIDTAEELLHELKQVIYGKDLFNLISKKLKESFS